MSASSTTKILLAFRSGDRCAFLGCTVQLTVNALVGADPSIIGEAAHISGEKLGAARYDESMNDAARNHYNNLIYLCPNHHTQIDKQHESFSVEILRTWKKEHEEKIRRSISEAFADIGFTELQMATAWVNRYQPAQDAEDYALLPPEAKIQKNGLRSESRVTIRMGLSVAKLVAQFVQAEALVDEDYPEKLKAGFLQEYFRLRGLGVKGDDLFELMCSFAQRGMQGQARRSAGLAVLVYLFEKCDVFEK